MVVQVDGALSFSRPLSSRRIMETREGLANVEPLLAPIPNPSSMWRIRRLLLAIQDSDKSACLLPTHTCGKCILDITLLLLPLI